MSNSEKQLIIKKVIGLASKLTSLLIDMGLSKRQINLFIARRIFGQKMYQDQFTFAQMLQKVLAKRFKTTAQDTQNLRIQLIHILSRLEIEIGNVQQFDKEDIRALPVDYRQNRTNQTSQKKQKVVHEPSTQSSDKSQFKNESFGSNFSTLAKLQKNLNQKMNKITDIHDLMRRSSDVRENLSMTARRNIFLKQKEEFLERQRDLQLQRLRLKQLQLLELQKAYEMQKEEKQMELMMQNYKIYENSFEVEEYDDI